MGSKGRLRLSGSYRGVTATQMRAIVHAFRFITGIGREEYGQMGIMDFIKGGVGEMMIARPDTTKGLLVYKHPDQTVPKHSQLTIDADDAVVFFRDGSVVGTLRTAGVGQRHRLTTENIPFLGQIIDKFTGGDVFVTELYFVTMRPVYDQRFGGELGLMEDPMLGEMVTPRIYGTFAFQVVDPEPFIIKYMGLSGQRSNEDLLRWISGKFMNGIKTVLGQVLVSEQKSMLELMPMQQMLAERFAAYAPDLAEIGCRIAEIGEFHINLSDDDEQRLRDAQAEIGSAKRAARVANIGVSEAEAKARQRQFELDQKFLNDARYVSQLAGSYGQYAAGQAMIGAGAGMAQGGGAGGEGSAMGSGAGLGMGMGMAQALAQQFAQGANPPAAPAGAVGAPPAASPPAVACPACSANVPAGKFCAECGAKLTPTPRYCSACGAQGNPGAKFCAECGSAYGQ